MKRKEKREIESQKNFFEEFLKIQKHFFKDLTNKLKEVKDKRNASYVIYGPDIILFMLIMKNNCSINSMNEMGDTFNKESCISNISKVLGYNKLEEIPHYDTINNFLKILENDQLDKIKKYMLNELFKKRSLEKYRLKDKYWKIAIDATGMFSFKKKHCEHCLKRKYKNKETGVIERVEYYHNVLEAKLILGDMVFSIATEFIENENEDVEKQDCELKAFKRLAIRLKEEYKRLPICILGDSLYACEPVFKICKKNRWKYILRFKEGSIPSLAEEFATLKQLEEKVDKCYNYVNGIDYNTVTVNVVEYIKQTDKKETTFVFVTDLNITKNNVNDVIEAGRSRWKIENEGFNNQKNVSYDLEHACCLDYNAMKNHYLLIQISDILKQIFENGSEVLKNLKLGKKNISSKLKHSFSREPLTVEDILNTSRKQIRDL
jgi:hypothetical protein